MAIARRSKKPPSVLALTTESCRSIMRARAASMAPRAASPCTADGVARDAVDAASSLGGHRANVPRNPLARLDCRSCSAAGWAETRTPLRHRRDTSQIPPAARAPPSCAACRKPHETASAPRTHPPASARGQTTRALPWEDANARLLRLGIKVAPRPARPGEIFPSPARARRAWMITGFFVTPCKYGRKQTNQLCPPPSAIS